VSFLVYRAINSVTAELAVNGIAKRHRNEKGDYAYRGIDDVLNTLAPLLPRHNLCVLPRVLEREAVRHRGGNHLVVVRVAFELVSAIDGSAHVVESFGEAIDDSDKGSAKAMSAAYKSAMLQTFCVPVPQDDTDASSPQLKAYLQKSNVSLSEPPEGWESWSSEVIDIAKSCTSEEAIDRLRKGRQTQLSALQRSRPELYAKVGNAIAVSLAALQHPATSPDQSRHKNGNRKPRETTDAAGTTSKAA